MTKPVPLSRQVREAVTNSGLSRYRISKLSGVSESILSRFMHGEGLSLENLDALAGVLGLRIVVDQRKAKGR